jgi:hypothetical protein
MRYGSARPGRARPGMVGHGTVGPGMARELKLNNESFAARSGPVWPGTAGSGKAWRGTARLGKGTKSITNGDRGCLKRKTTCKRFTAS